MQSRLAPRFPRVGAPTPSLGDLEEVDGEESSPGIEKCLERGKRKVQALHFHSLDGASLVPTFLPVPACHQLLECGRFSVSSLFGGPGVLAWAAYIQKKSEQTRDRGMGREGSLVLDCQHSGALYPRKVERLDCKMP